MLYYCNHYHLFASQTREEWPSSNWAESFFLSFSVKNECECERVEDEYYACLCQYILTINLFIA